MDIEGAEYIIFETMDIDYACAYFKQFYFETHPRNGQGKWEVPEMNFARFTLIKKLEKCFMLFHRDTRFFNLIKTKENGYLTEFQSSFKLDLLNFGSNEEEVIWYMLSTGELYFINKNFL